MNWFLLVFFGIMMITIILIVTTLSSLVAQGDERKKLIKMKAQSYTFIVVIVYLLFEVGTSMYLSLYSNNKYEGMNPYIFLVVMSIVYLITLLVYKRKYGD